MEERIEIDEIEEIESYLNSLVQKMPNGKSYYSLKEICFDLGYDFKDALTSAVTVLEIFKYCGFHVNSMFAFSYNKAGLISDIKMSKVALMFVSADIDKLGLQKNVAWKQIASVIYNSTDKFYAEKRFLARQEYSKLNNELNSALASLTCTKARGYEVFYEELYSTILKTYFRVDSKRELYENKELYIGQNYFDYISKTELEQLSWILKKLKLFIATHQSYDDIIFAAMKYAKEASDYFIKTYKTTPGLFPAHYHKPKTMLKQFYEMLNESGLKVEIDKTTKTRIK